MVWAGAESGNQAANLARVGRLHEGKQNFVTDGVDQETIEAGVFVLVNPAWSVEI